MKAQKIEIQERVQEKMVQRLPEKMERSHLFKQSLTDALIKEIKKELKIS